jgi:hypothetical protein
MPGNHFGTTKFFHPTDDLLVRWVHPPHFLRNHFLDSKTWQNLAKGDGLMD